MTDIALKVAEGIESAYKARDFDALVDWIDVLITEARNNEIARTRVAVARARHQGIALGRAEGIAVALCPSMDTNQPC